MVLHLLCKEVPVLILGFSSSPEAGIVGCHSWGTILSREAILFLCWASLLLLMKRKYKHKWLTPKAFKRLAVAFSSLDVEEKSNGYLGTVGYSGEGTGTITWKHWEGKVRGKMWAVQASFLEIPPGLCA